jgi:hypothetical protein
MPKNLHRDTAAAMQQQARHRNDERNVHPRISLSADGDRSC